MDPSDGRTTVRQRAMHEEDKALRRQSMLEAAERLLQPGEHTLPSISTIAGEVQLAKGTLYLYFRTKEEIYLALLERGLAQWIGTVRRALARTPTGEEIVRAYVDFCVDNPKVLHLASLSPVILERNISNEVAYQFKRRLAEEIRHVGEATADAFPGLSCERASDLFIYGYVLTLGLWQHTHPPSLVEEIYTRSEVSVLQLDFRKDLSSALRSLWTESLLDRGCGTAKAGAAP
jgi:AcrR family transcriptional regulator